jgi:carbon-monoxide dehydrogenase medium subunit
MVQMHPQRARGSSTVFPSSFDYVAAHSLEEALAAKREGGDDTRFLAGGQSLIPMMKTRLAAPAKLVDINGIPGLDTLERANGHLRVGALVRHADVAGSDLTFGAVRSAAPWISDPLVRNRGTLCGAVAHCDPEGDWNSVLLATGADVIARGSNGERSIPITDFVVDFFTNSLADDEMVTEVHIPVPSARSGGSYQKLERKVGDYATVAVAAHLELGDDGTITNAGVALTAVNPVNTKVVAADSMLVGQRPEAELFVAAAEVAAQASEPRDDVRGSAEWKRNVVRVFTRRALTAAAAEAGSAVE